MLAVFAHDFDDADNDLLAKLRFAVGRRVTRDLSLFGGLLLTGALAFDGKPGEAPSPFVLRTFEGDSTERRAVCRREPPMK
jgi:hypothetical protein